MGTFVFKWNKPASEVFVTGTFDNWAKTNQLTKQGDIFSKRVVLPSTSEQYYFKFVVDGEWLIDMDAPQANDAMGNTNNVLYEKDIEPLEAAKPSESNILSSVGTGATTTALAGAVPLEKDRAAASASKDDMPGAFPGTATTSDSQTFGVAPLPASGTFGNPISVKAGDPLPPPSSYTSNTVQNTVKLDDEAYSKGTALPSAGTAPATASDTSAFTVPPVSTGMIPESSLPMGAGASSVGIDSGPFISSTSGSHTTTSQLAAQVPLEPRGVPEVVQNSQNQGHFAHEAADSSAAVAHKEKMEQELQAKVPEEPATSEDSPAAKVTGNILTAGAAAIGGLAAGAAAYAGLASDKTQQAAEDIKAGKNPLTGAGGIPDSRDTAAAVPGTVAESFQKAHESPEAASNPAAVREKSAMEAELERKIPVTDESSGVGPSETQTAAMSARAPDALAGNPDDPVIADKDTMPAIAMAHGAASVEAPTATPGSAVGAGSGVSAATAGLVSSSSTFASDPVKVADTSRVGQSTAGASVPAFQSDPTSASYVDHVSTSAKQAAGTVTGAAGGMSESAKTTASQYTQSGSAGSTISQKAGQAAAAVGATAAAGAGAIGVGSAVGAENTTDASPSSPAATTGLNAPAASQAQTSSTSSAQAPPPSAAAHTSATTSTAGGRAALASAFNQGDSRDVSPMSKEPTVTSGLSSTQAPTQSTPTKTGQKGAAGPSSASASPAESKDDKSKKRRSFFGKIKDKIRHHE